jgi:hypothetical protein
MIRYDCFVYRLGNMTAILPNCFDRSPLPHWIPLPCKGDIIAVDEHLTAMLPDYA